MATGDSNEDREMQRSPLPQGLEYPNTTNGYENQQSHYKAEQALELPATACHRNNSDPVLWSSRSPIRIQAPRRRFQSCIRAK